MDQKAGLCKNCDYQLKSEFEFCPNCGQKTNDRLTIGVLFYNTISNYFSFDARFLKSVVPLITKPGFLAIKFIEGKRSRYLHPAQLYIFISIVFFFIFSISTKSQAEKFNEELLRSKSAEHALTLQDSIKVQQLDSTEKAQARKFLKNHKWLNRLSEKEIDSFLNRPNVKKNQISFGFNEAKIDSLISINASEKEIYNTMGMEDDAGWVTRKFFAQVLKFYKTREGGSILKTFYDTIPIALFFLLPFFALLLKLFFYKKGRYTHHLVFSFYYFSFLFMVFSIIFGMNLIWDLPLWVDVLMLLSAFVYFFIALRRFYHQSWLRSFFKANGITFLFLTLIIPTAVILIGGYAFLFY